MSSTCCSGSAAPYGVDHVTYVRNITDIDDKINARAKEERTTIRELTERTGHQFNEDIAALGVSATDSMIRVPLTSIPR